SQPNFNYSHSENEYYDDRIEPPFKKMKVSFESPQTTTSHQPFQPYQSYQQYQPPFEMKFRNDPHNVFGMHWSKVNEIPPSTRLSYSPRQERVCIFSFFVLLKF